MKMIINFFSDPIVLFSFLTVISLTIITLVHFKINITKMARNAAENALSYRLKVDSEKTRKREQLSKIGKKESKLAKKYRLAVTSIKIALNLTPLSVENFTTIFALFGVLIWAIAGFLLNNVIFGLFVAVPSIFAFLAFLLVVTKRKIRANDNAVMEALDMICPVIELGVVDAIKVNMSSFDRRIRHHFDHFVTTVEITGGNFDESMDLLANNLGQRFEDFAHKAKIYYDNEGNGMEDIFKDIIEANNDARSDNAELDEIFSKANQDLMMIAALLVGFLAYMYFNPMTRDFMLNTFWGTLVATIEISLLIMIYAISQLLQVDMPDIDNEENK